MSDTILILRATGTGRFGYQLLELDPAEAKIVAAWPGFEGEFPETPRTIGRPRMRPSELKGEISKAYRAAFKAWDGRAFGYDKAPEPVLVPPTVTLRQASHVGSYAKPWVARIEGAHPTYRFDRSFVAADETEKGGSWTYRLDDGWYELCNRNSKGDERRWFGRVAGGILVAVERAEVEAAFPAITAPAEATTETITPASDDTVECLECGATYPGHKAHLVDAGGMGCVRCNH